MAQFRDPYAAPYPDYRTNYQDADEYTPYGNNYGNNYNARNDYGNYDPYSSSSQVQARPTGSQLPTRSGTLQRGATSRTATTIAPPGLASNDDLDDPPPVPYPKNNISGATLLKRTDTRQSLTAAASMDKGDIKSWRKSQNDGLWTKGGRGRCFGRWFCCCFFTTLLLIVSIALTLVIWIRPPNVQFGGVTTNTGGSTFEATTNNQFKINLGFNITVNNPNYFSANFANIDVKITYPAVNNINVGGGSQKNVNFPSNKLQNISFPFSFIYDRNLDPDQRLISDLISRCGFMDPSQKRDLTIGYAVTLKLRVLFVNVGPTINGQSSFGCPVRADQIRPFLAGLGITIPGLN